MPITIRTVKTLQPGQCIWDDNVPCFGARRQTNSVSYIVKYRHLGKQRLVTLGRHGVLTPDQARRRARELLGSVASGADPAVKSETLGAVITEYLAQASLAQRPSTFRNTRRYLLHDWRSYHSLPV